jgi:YidC/Oxa1 family membrane protein insertase
MFDALARALAFFYDVWPSYGGAILLFTLAIMLLLSPLSIKSTRSMIKMQRVQPELKRLQTQYKGDREALNREMMAFYQANNINPFSSCLPMLLQMPVFIVLYRVLHGLTKVGKDGNFNPSYLDHGSRLFRDLRKVDEMMSFGVDLSRSALTAMKDGGIGTALPYFIMVAIVVGTTWYQQRQIAGRNPAAAANPQQQMMAKIVPFIMVPITVSIPAGVVIYFVASNLVRVGQQALVTKLEFGEGGSQTTIVKPTPTTPPPKQQQQQQQGKTGGGGRVTPSQNRNRSKKRKRK